MLGIPPGWAAPEQLLPEYLREEDSVGIFLLTPKTDIYSLGLVAYSLCTGGEKTEQQTQLLTAKDVIYANHILLLGEGEGKLGKVVGLTDKDEHYLKQQLHVIFFESNPEEHLPSANWISQ